MSYTTIIISFVIYLVLSILIYFMYQGGDYTGSDAAGNGMAKGFAILISLALYTIATLFYLGFNVYAYNSAHVWWFKVLTFLPAIPWLYILSTIK